METLLLSPSLVETPREKERERVMTSVCPNRVHVMSGLSQLLKDTDFFAGDLKCVQLPHTVTMMDLTIEAVCDRFDNAIDAEFDSLLQFMRILIKYSGAR
jgi:hypothetical protein